MQGILKGEFPISEEIHSTTLSLPISFMHTKEDIYRGSFSLPENYPVEKAYFEYR